MSSLTFSSMYLLVVLRMSKTLWDIDKKKMIPFKPFYKVKKKKKKKKLIYTNYFNNNTKLKI